MKPVRATVLAIALLAGCSVRTRNLVPRLECVDPSIDPGTGLHEPDIADATGLVLNGSAVVADGVLKVLPAIKNQSGSVYIATPFVFDATTSIFAHFAIRIGEGDGDLGGDGMAFVIQNSLAGPLALGPNGDSLGCKGLAPSIAVEFDTAWNGFEEDGNHLALTSDCDVFHHAEHAVPPFLLNDGVVRQVWIVYNAALLRIEVYMSESALRPSTPLLAHSGLNLLSMLGNQVYLGVSASTGDTINDHALLGEAWFAPSSLPPCD